MSYKQTRPFEQSLGGKIAGSCLANTRKGFRIASKYPNAWVAWLNTEQHTGSPPVGLDAPVFFWYINESNGHIGVRLANGKFWSDGDTYASIAAYEAVKKPRYRGWGESVNGVQVIQSVPDSIDYRMPKVGEVVRMVPNQQDVMVRTTYKEGTTVVAGQIRVPARDTSWVYTVLDIDKSYPNRIIVNSASGGGKRVSVALYYLDGGRIDNWEIVK